MGGNASIKVHDLRHERASSGGLLPDPVVATEAELAAAIDKAEAIQVTEDALFSSMAEGVSLFDKLSFDEHVKNVRASKASSLSFDA